jgi:hypothetical protein
MKVLKIIVTILGFLIAVAPVNARDFNDKLMNRPYADLRCWHLGFSIGAHAEDIRFTHNGLITEQGEEWRIDQPDYQPGFCVNGLVALRLNDYFSLRFSPGMYFGSRDIRMYNVSDGATERQNIKSTFVVMPLDLKYASLRYRNCRPYVTTGIMPAFDVAKKRSDFIKTKSSDFYLSFGFGCDFYLPYFKLIPELKFCLGLGDVLCHDRPDLEDDPMKLKFTQSVKKAVSKMIVLTFYFE